MLCTGLYKLYYFVTIYIMIGKDTLLDLYVKKNLSMKQISNRLGCSVNKVSYWMNQHGISRRSISQSTYIRRNPKGDPFAVHKPQTQKEAILYGIGLGLYWGEGTKANKHSIRLGNTDPRLIKIFIKFLSEAYSIQPQKLRFGVQVFSNMPKEKVLSFWKKTLKVSDSQFSKVIVTPSRGEGTYHRKIQYGVLTVYYHNRKLRDILCGEIEKIDEIV